MPDGVTAHENPRLRIEGAILPLRLVAAGVGRYLADILIFHNEALLNKRKFIWKREKDKYGRGWIYTVTGKQK